MKQICAGLVMLALITQTTPSWASNDSTLSQAGYGAGSVLGTLVYAPFKATFCILGGIGAAFTAIASPPTAGDVARASCGGTWIITPSAVKGDEPVHVVGEARTARVSTSEVATN